MKNDFAKKYEKRCGEVINIVAKSDLVMAKLANLPDFATSKSDFATKTSLFPVFEDV